ncbi:MAG TPA: RNA polymerase sporulation sigma factor SigK [Bacillota bacterium]|nr:RNA polymerase sporulation sigma factor SigK [Bacillota bacterium]HOP70147.1 RNA polymerase sporulation sigma factor SigK [Bacillota bacterium]HPT35071.1 RNA polymerase sporulation sigma factor SigK [Bacillota bacterium]HPZ86148.1 RNA polymerase sporulation sigma factor SigK [Bacillota bacterium]HQD85686.1 RNA polymerase sporulation sigma factor SigK [Bacillota bacterium]
MLLGIAAIILEAVLNCFGYLTGNHFPPPLSETDELFHLNAVRDGNVTSRNVLIEHNLRLVAHIVKKFDPNPQDVEDLISIGSIGLVKAIDTFCQDRGTRLATYASKCIENEILMHLRATKNNRNEVHLFEPLTSDSDDGDVSYIDIIKDQEPDIADVVAAKVQAENVLAQFDMLDDKEKQVLQYRYGLNGKVQKTQREIANMLGISRSYVSRIEKRALAKLAKACKPFAS